MKRFWDTKEYREFARRVSNAKADRRAAGRRPVKVLMSPFTGSKLTGRHVSEFMPGMDVPLRKICSVPIEYMVEIPEDDFVMACESTRDFSAFWEQELRGLSWLPTTFTSASFTTSKTWTVPYAKELIGTWTALEPAELTKIPTYTLDIT